jgi:hypothetical protein
VVSSFLTVVLFFPDGSRPPFLLVGGNVHSPFARSVTLTGVHLLLMTQSLQVCLRPPFAVSNGSEYFPCHWKAERPSLPSKLALAVLFQETLGHPRPLCHGKCIHYAHALSPVSHSTIFEKGHQIVDSQYQAHTLSQSQMERVSQANALVEGIDPSA